MKASPLILALWMPMAFLSGGCQPTRVDPVAKQMAYLGSGKLTQEELLLHLGTPTGRFENDRILTWRMGSTYLGELGPAARAALPDEDYDDWQGTTYDLVIVFDDHRQMQRYRLIPVRRT